MGLVLKPGFPLLKNRTLTSEEQLKSLLNLCIEIAGLPGNVANAQTIHQA